jgi:hypothetical protein
MAKMTVLEMTQNILNDMDSDAVNSIDDTEESIQIAEIVRQSYYNLCALRDWPFLRTLTVLEGLADTAHPTTMLIPETVNKILWFKYNKKDVTYLDPKDFLDVIDKRTPTASIIDSNGYGLNRDPQYWTTYDDKYIVLDSRNSATDTTLIGSKSKIYAVLAPVWTAEDDFIPLMPEKMFSTLLASAKSTAFLALKQQANPKEESYASRGITRAQNESWRVDAGETGVYNKQDYGRK